MPRLFKYAKCAAATLMFGGVLTQLGPCTAIAGQTALAAGAGSLVGDDGTFLFVFNVCGIPDVILVDENGAATSAVLNVEDDLFFGCPVTTVGP